jgi:hypothetical protein
MKTLALMLGMVATALASIGCSRPFDVKTAPGFVELENQEPQYDYRALAPEGIVMAVRVVPIKDHGDLQFWARATTLRMRQLNGYALLAEADVKSRDGTPGKELRFGHDEHGKPYVYEMRLFVRDEKLFVVETGGAQEQMDRYKPSVDWMQASVSLK